ncbi:MAG: GNAT family N-acetyltransferase [Thermoplasmata archaeon]|nr:GNAT family N-acetyltransferase [Thermoplasmata archaeon]
MPFLSHPTVVDFLEAERERRGWVGKVRRLRGARVVTNPRYRAVLWANQILVGATEPPVEWEEIRAQAEPTFRALGIPGRRVMLFGEEVRSRLGGSLLGEGFHERPLGLLAFRGVVTARPQPEITVRRVDPFLRPAWLTLSYRVEQERGESGPGASDRVSFYSSQADKPGRRTFAGFMGDSMAGSCDLSRIGSLASIEHVQTAPEWRGQGVATAVVLRATEEAVHDGARGVQLTTRSVTLGEQLYRPCGFEGVSVVSIFERTSVD